MPTAKMTSKGQVTIPKQVRQRLRLGTGDQVEFVLQEAGTVLLRPLDRPVRELFEILPRTEGAAPSLEQLDQSILDDRAADDERIRSQRDGCQGLSWLDRHPAWGGCRDDTAAEAVPMALRWTRFRGRSVHGPAL